MEEKEEGEEARVSPSSSFEMSQGRERGERGDFKMVKGDAMLPTYAQWAHNRANEGKTCQGERL